MSKPRQVPALDSSDPLVSWAFAITSTRDHVNPGDVANLRRPDIRSQSPTCPCQLHPATHCYVRRAVEPSSRRAVEPSSRWVPGAHARFRLPVAPDASNSSNRRLKGVLCRRPRSRRTPKAARVTVRRIAPN